MQTATVVPAGATVLSHVNRRVVVGEGEVSRWRGRGRHYRSSGRARVGRRSVTIAIIIVDILFVITMHVIILAVDVVARRYL